MIMRARARIRGKIQAVFVRTSLKFRLPFIDFEVCIQIGLLEGYYGVFSTTRLPDLYEACSQIHITTAKSSNDAPKFIVANVASREFPRTRLRRSPNGT